MTTEWITASNTHVEDDDCWRVYSLTRKGELILEAERQNGG